MNALYKPFQPTLTVAGLQRFGLTLQQAPACETLSGMVHSYLQISAAGPTPYPVIPDGTQAVFIGPQGAKLSGSQTHACDVPILQAGEYFGIRFYPGALRHFFKLDLSEITDRFVAEHDVPCRDFVELHHILYQCRSFQARAQVCEQWLLRHFNPHAAGRFEYALSVIYQSLGNIPVSRLAAMTGWSGRHLNRLFRLHTGLGTKTFAETIRLQHACKRLFISPGDALNTALELGFFDQSHLIKDYKKRLLASPGVFWGRFMSDFYNK